MPHQPVGGKTGALIPHDLPQFPLWPWLKFLAGVEPARLPNLHRDYLAYCGQHNRASAGDATMLPELLPQIPEAEELATVTTDGAYDTRLCHATIAVGGAADIIPSRRNGPFWKGCSRGNQPRNESLSSVKCLGRTLWKKWSGYHRRSLVKTKIHCFK